MWRDLSRLYQSKLGKTYISSLPSIVHSPHFESGVTKIQRNQIHLMYSLGKNACKRLLSPTTDSATTELHNQSSASMTVSERFELRKRKREEETEKYINSDFILGSVAEIERLRSLAKNVLTDNRKSMTPLVFEAVLFLKVKSTYWNEYTVKEAMEKVKSEKVQNRLKEDTQHQQLADIS